MITLDPGNKGIVEGLLRPQPLSGARINVSPYSVQSTFHATTQGHHSSKEMAVVGGTHLPLAHAHPPFLPTAEEPPTFLPNFLECNISNLRKPSTNY